MAFGKGIKAGRAYVELNADRSKLVAGLKLAQRDLSNFSRSVTAMGQSLLKTSAILATPMAISTKLFADFDDQMRIVKAVTGSTGKEFEALVEKAKTLGATTSFTAKQAASGMVELGRAGFTAKEILNSIAGVMDLSRATTTELAEATNIAASTLRSFNLEADQMGRVADVLTATANNSAQTLTDLGEAMKYSAPVAAEFGMTLEDTAKSLGALANFAIRGSMAGNTLKNIMLRMASPSIRKEIEGQGVAVTDASGRFRNLADIMRDLGTATQKLPQAEKLDLFNKLFGLRAVTGGAKLTSTVFENLSQAIDKSAGTAERTAKEMDSGIGGSFRRIMSAAEGVAIAIGTALAKPISTVTDLLTTLLGRIKEWVDNNRALIVTMGVIVVGIGLIGGALLTLGLATKVIAVGLGGLVSILKILGTSLALSKAAFLALISPIGLLSVIVIALAARFVDFSKISGQAINYLLTRFPKLTSGIQASISAMGKALAQGNLTAAVDVLWAAIKIAWQKGINFIQNIWFSAQNWLAMSWLSIELTAIKSMEGIEQAWSGTVAFFQKVWLTFQNWHAQSVVEWSSGLVKAWAWAKSKIDKDFSYDAAMSYIDQDRKAAVDQLNREMDRKNQEINSQRESERAGIAQNYDELRTGLEQGFAEKYASMQSDQSEKLSKTEQDYKNAVASWREAINAIESASSDTADDKKKDGNPLANLPGTLSQLAGATPAGVEAKVAGTFSDRAATQLGSSNRVEDRMANSLSSIDSNMSVLVDEIRLNGATFQ